MTLILGQFSKQADNKQSVECLNRLLVKDRCTRHQSAQEKTPLSVRPEALQNFDKAFFAQLQKEAKQLKDINEHLRDELAICDRQLSTVPEADMIKAVAQELKSAEDNSKIAQGEIITLQKLYDETIKATNSKHNELDRLLHNANNEH